MEKKHDVAIVGGGLNGTALALSLAQAGLTVVVLDRSPVETRAEAGFDGRAYALALASQRLLAAIGLWDSLKSHAQPILKVLASDGRPGEGASPWVLDLDHAEIEEGPMGYMVEDRALRPALLNAVARVDAITHIGGADVVFQTTNAGGISVTCADGTAHFARLLVGADGRQSGTAQRAGISYERKDYGQDALVCAVAHEHAHDGIAHQFFMPNGPLAILPLFGNKSAIVWSEERGLAQELHAGTDEKFLEALKPRFGDFLGDIALCGERHRYPLGLSLAKSFVEDRLVLIGDAAQGVHPIAGQGLNQGLRDIATLAQVLADAHRRGEDIGAPDVLDRHRQWRSFDRTTLVLATDTFNQLFSNDNPLLRFGRDLGMAAVSAFPGLRRRVIREAAGLNGDVPRLLKGQPV
jgi:2-octaprenyl-6-methoxyphenol hydroxylase